MSWWLDLADGPVFDVQIIEGNPHQVAVWLTASSVRSYTVAEGSLYAAFEINPPDNFNPTDDAWRAFVDSLRVPHGDYFPCVVTDVVTILTSYDGRLRLYWDRAHRLTLESDGYSADLLCDDDSFSAVGLDRDLGTVAALSGSQVRLYQQHVFVGGFPLAGIGLQKKAAVFVPDASGESIIVGENGAQIIDLSGRVQARLDDNGFVIGASACTPEGSLVVVGERDRAMLHIYDAWLNLLFQGHAHSLLESAQSLQLMARKPTQHAKVEALAIADDGVLVFAMNGVVCCSHVELLPEMPYPKTLF